MEIKFNENWNLSRSINMRMWQHSSEVIFIDIAKYDAERLFESVFDVNKRFLKIGHKNGYEFIKVILDALKEKRIKEHLAYILIRITDDMLIGSWGGLVEKKIGKRRYTMYEKLVNSYQVSFESTQAMALAERFQVDDLKNDPENYIESEVFKLLVDNYDLVRRITKEYEGISTFEEYCKGIEYNR